MHFSIVAASVRPYRRKKERKEGKKSRGFDPTLLELQLIYTIRKNLKKPRKSVSLLRLNRGQRLHGKLLLTNWRDTGGYRDHNSLEQKPENWKPSTSFLLQHIFFGFVFLPNWVFYNSIQFNSDTNYSLYQIPQIKDQCP